MTDVNFRAGGQSAAAAAGDSGTPGLRLLSLSPGYGENAPVSAITWRERFGACTPLAGRAAVPTAALLKDPMIRCVPF